MVFGFGKGKQETKAAAPAPTPVSYTHLDVYKRQTSYLWLAPLRLAASRRSTSPSPSD